MGGSKCSRLQKAKIYTGPRIHERITGLNLISKPALKLYPSQDHEVSWITNRANHRWLDWLASHESKQGVQLW